MKTLSSSLSEMLIPASYIIHVEELASVADYKAALKQAGIEKKSLTEHDAKVTAQQFLTLIEEADKLYTGDYPASLLVAKHFNISTHGILGLALMSSTTVGGAIELGLKYAHLAMPAVKFDVDITDQIIVTLSPGADLGAAHHTLIEISMAALKSFMDQVLEVTPIAGVEFQHPCRFSTQHYREYFCCPVRFSQSANRLHIKLLDMSTPMKSGNQYTAKLLTQQLADQTRSGVNIKPWTYKVEEYCRDHKHRLAQVSKQEVAEFLCITTRTLSRRLNQEGGGFQDIVNTNILNYAVKLLARGDLNIDQIAEKLGFSSTKYFSRYFKRMKGVSPTDYRKQL